jgi:hypothetical protein
MSALADHSSRVAHLEHLLRARKLDRTLTTTIPDRAEDDDRAPFDVAAIDRVLGGGLPRGQVSEIAGPASSGRTSLAWAWLAAATRRGESVALIDTFDRFDLPSGAACGIDLSRLLWVRGQAVTKTAGAIDPAWRPGERAVEGPGTLVERTVDRALKSLNLVLQSGVCTAVVLDLADVPLAGLRRIPATTWLRLQRIISGHETTCLLVGPVPLARSAGGLSIRTGASSRPEGCFGGTSAVRWAGTHDRARRLAGLDLAVQIVSPRRREEETVCLPAFTR